MNFDLITTLAVIGVCTSVLPLAYVYAAHPVALWPLPRRGSPATGGTSQPMSLRRLL